MFKITLNLNERFTILGRIPQKGKYQVLIFAKAVTDLLKISAEDVEAYKIEEVKGDDGQMTGIKWDAGIDNNKEFELKTKGELKILLDIVKAMDENEEITTDNLSLVTKIFDLATEAGLYEVPAED